MKSLTRVENKPIRSKVSLIVEVRGGKVVENGGWNKLTDKSTNRQRQMNDQETDKGGGNEKNTRVVG